jgi:uncharacterized protein (TIGR02246 family)
MTDTTAPTHAETPEDIPRLFVAAWMARDAQALAALFVEDADFVNVVGLWWHNRADIQRAHHYGLTTFFKDSQISARGVKVRRVSDTVAIVHTRWRLTGQIDPQGAPLDSRTAVMVFVAEKRAEGWKVLAAHNTDVIPGAETNGAREDTLTGLDYRG